jgi:hypothetical protein
LSDDDDELPPLPPRLVPLALEVGSPPPLNNAQVHIVEQDGYGDLDMGGMELGDHWGGFDRPVHPREAVNDPGGPYLLLLLRAGAGLHWQRIDRW